MSRFDGFWEWYAELVVSVNMYLESIRRGSFQSSSMRWNDISEFTAADGNKYFLMVVSGKTGERELIARQMGTSAGMIEKHYSHLILSLSAELLARSSAYSFSEPLKIIVALLPFSNSRPGLQISNRSSSILKLASRKSLTSRERFSPSSNSSMRTASSCSNE